MKAKIIVIPVLAAVGLFIISYTTMKKNGVEKPIASPVEKKAPQVVKAKPKKKKEKKITTPVNKPKAETQQVKNISYESPAPVSSSPNAAMTNILASKIFKYAAENSFSTEYCFLVDMSLPSGRNRFFVYDLTKNSIVFSGLVAHGSCNETFMARPRFSNEPKGGCSSLGKYKIGEFYRGKYGKSYRLYGLDYSNSNAFKRAVVIHGYNCVPDEEIYPRVLCNSLGCVMVSYKFFDKISRIISRSEKPIVLWVYQ